MSAKRFVDRKTKQIPKYIPKTVATKEINLPYHGIFIS